MGEIRAMFGRIAPRYDLLNRLMSLGRDQSWRRQAANLLGRQPTGLVLDIGAGSGDLTLEFLKHSLDRRAVACDFAPPMVFLGRQRTDHKRAAWVIADGMALPFAAGSFDGVISGFLLRNVPDLRRALAEQERVLKAGGKMVALDTTPPPKGLLRPLVDFYLQRLIPWLGQWIAGDRQAYAYLARSTQQFLSAERLAERLQETGFSQVGFIRRMAGVVAIHHAEKKPAKSASSR